jgi:hypothetical protein
LNDDNHDFLKQYEHFRTEYQKPIKIQDTLQKPKLKPKATDLFYGRLYPKKKYLKHIQPQNDLLLDLGCFIKTVNGPIKEKMIEYNTFFDDRTIYYDQMMDGINSCTYSKKPENIINTNNIEQFGNIKSKHDDTVIYFVILGILLYLLIIYNKSHV